LAKRHKKHGQANIADAINDAKGGDFGALLGDRTEDWWSFVRERLDGGASQLMLRIEHDDSAFGSWYMWLEFEGDDQCSSIALTRILVPDYETKPDSALAIPDGYEHVPFFVYRWDA
jgi:hypothetical protein